MCEEPLRGTVELEAQDPLPQRLGAALPWPRKTSFPSQPLEGEYRPYLGFPGYWA